MTNNNKTIKEMKRITLISILTVSMLQAFAQDIIVKNDKTEVKAKIEELTETTIKYKKFEMLEGPIYNINKRDVFMIIYKNGTKEYIEASNSTPTISNNQSNGIEIDPIVSQQKVNQGLKTSTESNNKVASSELIEIKGNKYFYKGEPLTSWEKINNVFEKNNAIESLNYMKKRKSQWIGGASLAGVGGIGLVAFNLGQNPNSTLSTVSGLVMCSGAVLALMSGTQPKKAITSFNNSVQKVSFTPIIKSDDFGQRVGLSMGF